MSSLACCGGSIDEGIPLGNVEEISGIKCYISQKPESNFNEDVLIIISTDVFGYTLPNTRLLADKFSKEMSSLCVVPDLFDGTEPPANLMDSIEVITEPTHSIFKKIYAIGRMLWYFPAFLYNNPKTKCISRLETVIKEYRDNRGIKKVAMQGYCFGGGLSISMGQKPYFIDVFCAAHPAGFDVPTTIANLIKPGAFILTPDKDMQLKHPQCDMIADLLKKRDEPVGTFPHLVKIYRNIHHGFAVRGDEKNPEVNAARVEAFNLAVTFFKQILQL
jgi:dienelactone hydrolase